VNITVISTVFGDWFEKYGQQFVSMLEEANCEQAILVSDKKVVVPSFINLIVKDFTNHADFNNVATDALETDWGLYMGFDDLVMEDGLADIDSEADIYGWPHQMSGLQTGLSSYSGNYENTWNLGYNPMAGCFAYRKELMQEIPFRDYLYLDWIHFCETSYHGKTFEASETPRTIWVRREDSLAYGGNREAENQVYNFQRKLQDGLIHKGIPE